MFLDDDIHSTHRLVYVGVSDADPSAALDEPRRVDRIDDAEEAIAEQLDDGTPKPSRGVKTAVMAELDVSERTVKRAAHRMQGRGELRIERTNTKGPATTWRLVLSRSSQGHSPPDGPTNETPINTGDSKSGHSGESGAGPTKLGHEINLLGEDPGWREQFVRDHERRP